MSELDPETHQLHDEQMAKDATLQMAVNAVQARNSGQDVPTLVEMLRQSVAAHDLPQPTEDWLTAVAAEISVGHRYVVGPQSVHDAGAAERAAGGDRPDQR